MKNTLPKIAVLCTVFAAAISLQSCDKVASVIKTPDINFSGASTDVVIPVTTNTTAQGNLSTASISYNIDSMIKAQTGGVVSYSSIKSVKISKISLSLNDADSTNNFGNFETAGATFNTDASGGSLSPYTIAYIDNNPSTYNTTLDLPLVDKDTNLKQYFGSGTVTFTYAITGKLRRATTKDLHCHVNVAYSIGF